MDFIEALKVIEAIQAIAYMKATEDTQSMKNTEVIEVSKFIGGTQTLAFLSL